MAQLSIRALRPDEAEKVAGWAYEAPFDIYNGDPTDISCYLDHDEQGLGYYAIAEGDDVVGFCCFGEAARVPPQVAELGTLDLGGGVRPDRVSRGLATAVLPEVLRFGSERWAPDRFRVAVAAFNDRPLRLCLSAGFTEVGRFANRDGREFVELILANQSPSEL